MDTNLSIEEEELERRIREHITVGVIEKYRMRRQPVGTNDPDISYSFRRYGRNKDRAVFKIKDDGVGRRCFNLQERHLNRTSIREIVNAISQFRTRLIEGGIFLEDRNPSDIEGGFPVLPLDEIAHNDKYNHFMRCLDCFLMNLYELLPPKR